MLVWNKSINGLPPHQKTVFGWNTRLKTWIHKIWWDEDDGTWNGDDYQYDKDEISHWMEHPSEPKD